MRTRHVERLVKILLERKAQIERNIQDVLKETTNAAQGEVVGDDADLATFSSNAQTGAAISEQQQRELKEIEHALKKVNQGTFGVCEMCGEQIGIDRMRVKPHARYCIICREVYEQNANGAPTNGFIRARRIASD